MHDETWMRLALEQAALGRGRTSPNPMVGAVIVRDGRVIGRGYHARAGDDHAEVAAIRAATEPTTGATMYVTLEPCSHQGRTPACTQAILDAGIWRVVIGCDDPNPGVSGQGGRLLRSAGLDVQSGVLAGEARDLVRAFLLSVELGRPFVTAKIAATMDGRTATRSGESRWISGEESRRVVHQLRDEVDAILVGRGTVQVDNPRLTTRLGDSVESKHPLRVVLDAHGRLGTQAHVFELGLPGKTLLVTTELNRSDQVQVLRDRGIDVVVCGASDQGRVDLDELMSILNQRQLLHVMCEGGPRLLASLQTSRLIDEYWIFLAPIILGGDGQPCIADLGIDALRDGFRLQPQTCCRLGEDWLIRSRVRR